MDRKYKFIEENRNLCKEDIPEIKEWLEYNDINKKLTVYETPDKKRERTLIELAANNKAIEVVEFLIKSGADVYSCSEEHWSTLMEFSAAVDYLDTIKCLLKNGYDREVFLKDNSLICAATNNFPDVVKFLIEQGKDIEQFLYQDGKVEEGITALKMAVQENSVECVKLLCELGANKYNYVTEENDSIIDFAAMLGNLEIIKYFLENGFDREVFLKDGSLISAAINNHTDVVKYLIEQGKYTEQCDDGDGFTALRLAAQMGSTECVKLLCEMGANIEVDSNCGTPLFGAASSGDLETVKVLIDHGANVNCKTNSGDTPYSIAKYHGDKDIINYLLEHGADPNLADPDLDTSSKKGGKIPSVWIAYNSKEDAYLAAKREGEGQEPIHHNGDEDDSLGYRENIQRKSIPGIENWLEKHNIDMPSEDSKLTWLEFAITQGSLELVKFLIKNDENQYQCSSYDWETLIEFAAMYGCLYIIKYFLENGYDREIFLRDNSVIFAASNDFPCVIKYLVKQGKDIEHFLSYSNNKYKHTTEGYTALRDAAQENSIECVRLLCELGANVNVEGKDTPLYSAAAEGNLKIVKILIEYGADVNYKNESGTTPLRIAKKYKHKDIADYLLAHGAKIN